MNETCDWCRKKASVLEIVFTGRQYLCLECAEKKSPTAMGSAMPIAQLAFR